MTELYQGGDFVGYLFKQGLELHPGAGAVKSITAVRDGAVIVTEHAIYVAKPYDRIIGFTIQQVHSL